MRPASSSSPPNAIRYPFTTHARLLCEKPRSSWIEGSATFTIVASITIISTPAQSTYSASQRLRSLVISAVTLSHSSRWVDSKRRRVEGPAARWDLS